MASIVTDSFRIKNAADLIESIAEDSLYLFIGKTSPWTIRSSSDTVPPIPSDTINETQRQHWADMIGAKRVTSADAIHMVRRINWMPGTRYDAYNSNDPDLFRKNFYVLTDSNNVYKCLSNGAPGAVSTNKPTFTSSTTVQTFGDGYVWKYMYTIDASSDLKFLTPQHMPVINLIGTNANNNTAIFGSISENPVYNGVSGHGFNAVRELGAYYIGINTRFEFSENGLLITDNDYRKIGLVYNPLDASNNLVAQSPVVRQTTLITLATVPSGIFLADESITTSAGDTATVVEHSIADRTKLYVIVENGELSPGEGITGASSGVTGTISSSVGSVLNPQLLKNSGDIIFVEYRRPIPRSGDQIESLSLTLEF